MYRMNVQITSTYSPPSLPSFDSSFCNPLHLCAKLQCWCWDNLALLRSPTCILHNSIYLLSYNPSIQIFEYCLSQIDYLRHCFFLSQCVLLFLFLSYKKKQHQHQWKGNKIHSLLCRWNITFIFHPQSCKKPSQFLPRITPVPNLLVRNVFCSAKEDKGLGGRPIIR